MKDALVEKLNRVLGKPIVTEEGVVYTLVEVRKLLERCNVNRQDFKPIWFLCDWVAHTELDRKKGWASELLSFADRVLQQGLAWDALPEADKLFVTENYSLDGIRNVLIRWLSEQGVFAVTLGYTTGWYWFVRNLSEVVADCPLKLNGGALVEQVTFEIVKGNIPGTRLDFEWTFTRKDDPKPFKWIMPTYFEKPDGFFGRNGRRIAEQFEEQLRERGLKSPWD